MADNTATTYAYTAERIRQIVAQHDAERAARAAENQQSAEAYLALQAAAFEAAQAELQRQNLLRLMYGEA